MRMRVIDGYSVCPYCVKNWCCDTTTTFAAQCGILQSGISSDVHLFYEQKSTEVKNHPLKDPLCNQNQACLCNISNPGIVSLPFDVPSWELSVWFPADSSRFRSSRLARITLGILPQRIWQKHLGRRSVVARCPSHWFCQEGDCILDIRQKAQFFVFKQHP